MCTCVHTNEPIVMMDLLLDHCFMVLKVTILVIQIKRKSSWNDNSLSPVGYLILLIECNSMEWILSALIVSFNKIKRKIVFLILKWT